jgi:hypothetical protein
MINERNWGKNGCFMFIMAPSFFWEISQKELEKLSKPVKNDPFKADYTEQFDNTQNSAVSD